MAIRLVGPKFISATLICLTPRPNASPLVAPGGIQLATSQCAKRVCCDPLRFPQHRRIKA